MTTDLALFSVPVRTPSLGNAVRKGKDLYVDGAMQCKYRCLQVRLKKQSSEVFFEEKECRRNGRKTTTTL